VDIEPYTAERAARIAELVQPREVVVQQGGPYHLARLSAAWSDCSRGLAPA
jgi:hypothetical protein